MKAYLELRDRHQQEMNAFPMFFAFSKSQFDEGMKSIGLKPNQTGLVVQFFSGSFMKKTDLERYKKMCERHNRERSDAMAGDTNGTGFLLDMFRYELRNHEYGYTHEIGETLASVCLTMQMVQKNPAMFAALNRAIEEIEAGEG